MTTPDHNHGEFVIYTTDDGRTEIHLRVIDGTVWMTQAEIADLFDVTPAAISHHIQNITREKEINTTFKQLLKVPGQARSVNHYNLDMVLAVGYRVRGPRGAQFRRWATTVLKEYLIKGFALNDDKLKDPRGADYFDELLAQRKRLTPRVKTNTSEGADSSPDEDQLREELGEDWTD